MRISEYITKRLKELDEQDANVRQDIYNIRNGLDLKVGEPDRDEETKQVLNQSRNAKLHFNEGARQELIKLRGKISGKKS